MDIITNPGKKQFEERKIELQKTGGFEQRLMFHGSPTKNYESKAKEHFVLDDVRNGRVHGDGVYVTEHAEVALDYNVMSRTSTTKTIMIIESRKCFVVNLL